ncbi:hypothetical protein NDA01_16180 [Trichocoleus desertorum AS-A10]|uniref:hypothetical protein n=1 Tax=Trichocoleus desertorum TaxID=1481672 RepID=UPI003297B211
MSNLDKKRLDVALAIAGYAVGSGAAVAVPTFGGELPKQVLLSTSDVLMYTRIWKIYFEEDLSHSNLMEMLTQVGLVTVAATGVAYIVAKGSTAILKEFTNWLGPLGWGATAAIAGSLAALSGAAWALYCDYLYAERNPQPTT